MRVRVSKWGNSLAIRLPNAAVESLHVHEGDAVDLAIEDERVVIRPVRPRYWLADLVAEMDPANQPKALDVPPGGEELL